MNEQTQNDDQPVAEPTGTAQPLTEDMQPTPSEQHAEKSLRIYGLFCIHPFLDRPRDDGNIGWVFIPRAH